MTTPDEICAIYQQVQENFRKNLEDSRRRVKHDRFWQNAANLRCGTPEHWYWITGGWANWPAHCGEPFYAELKGRE